MQSVVRINVLPLTVSNACICRSGGAAGMLSATYGTSVLMQLRHRGARWQSLTRCLPMQQIPREEPVLPPACTAGQVLQHHPPKALGLALPLLLQHQQQAWAPAQAFTPRLPRHLSTLQRATSGLAQLAPLLGAPAPTRPLPRLPRLAQG